MRKTADLAMVKKTIMSPVFQSILLKKMSDHNVTVKKISTQNMQRKYKLCVQYSVSDGAAGFSAEG